MGIFSIFSKKNNDHEIATQNSTEKVENKEHSTLETQSQEAVTVDLSETTAIAKKEVESSPMKVKLTFMERLKRTRENLAYGLSALVVGRKIDEDLYEDLETALLTADLGVETTQSIINKLKEESKLRELHDAGALKENLKKILKEILAPCEVPLDITKKADDLPYVILMVGVNGAGKTTTIGKL
ncbi:MAG: signal recognition particle receptor subunit alpha, partial [Succinivibrio sp.]|nr:signal recognition particle receptor subunit alpha [Succinivibrio sp.]